MSDNSSQSGTRQGARRRGVKRFAEYVVLFFIVPGSMALGLVPNRPLTALFAAVPGVLWVLLRDPTFDRSRLRLGSIARRDLLLISLRFCFGALLLFAAMFLLAPERLFVFVRQKPAVWGLVMLLYPVLSVLPQEIIFRVFVFHRYAQVFRSGMSIQLASAAAFGWVHILFGSWISVVLTLAGGIIFASTYFRTSSLLLVCFEHALYGQFVFTIGLGPYFYRGWR